MDARREQAEKMLRAELKKKGRTMTEKEFREAVDHILREADKHRGKRG